ncbi:MAG TPA: metalloregulator ArsR/SmtB family transcription factor [Candidatus Acidoferrales bacterium]|nr:metalloregulator ArsR/SmtB family transcription factor [Candidatus Acidoferrales bacterium]
MKRSTNPRRRRRVAAYAGLRKPVLHQLFRALADPTRLRLLNLVGGREVCVCYLVEILGLNQPKISRHLAYLRRAGLVEVRREGKWMHYRLALPKDRVAAQILLGTLEAMQKDPRMRYDLAHLSAACCSPEKYEVPRGAPMPEELLRPEDAPVFPSPNETMASDL